MVPKDINELRNYLSSKEKLVIDLDKTFDFTGSEGWVTVTGCFYKKCRGITGSEKSIAQLGTCNGRERTQVKYSKAGLTELIVSSYKTVKSSNGRGTIKGKGLRIKNAEQVIIRDITITDINPEVIWAGDALGFDKVNNVWIHKVTFRRIGRQHLVSFQQANTGITVSSCFFDGSSPFSGTCDGRHYWVWIFWGTNDQITLINNHVSNTAARLPHAGGWSKSWNNIHMIGNFLENNPHTGIEPHMGSNILCEGNIFSKFKKVINNRAHGGHLALVNTPQDAATCKKFLGEACLVNKYPGSRRASRFETSVLSTFAKLDRYAINSARKAVCV